MSTGQDLARPNAGKATKLSRDSITMAAIEFIEQQGIEKLSMRSLATKIGCGTMSLYSYVESKEDLIESIVGTLTTMSRVPDIVAQSFDSWQELARTVSHAYRELAYRYPRSHELLALAPYDLGPVAAYLEDLVQAVLRTGLTDDQAYRLLGALDAYVTGFLTVSVRSAVTPQSPSPNASAQLRGLRAPEMFESGLEVFIRGFEEYFKDEAAQGS